MSTPHDTMLTAQMADLLRRLRAGELGAADAASFEDLPAAGFVQEIRRRYPVLFQERSIGRKVEIGLAKSLQFQLVVPSNGRQAFGSVELLPVLRNCLMLSMYDGQLSGIAVAKSIRLRPSPAESRGVIVAMGSGYKLDKMPDGWVSKTLGRRSTTLSESFLKARGWKFDVLQPFSPKS